jgi:hypothetical protein
MKIYRLVLISTLLLLTISCTGTQTKINYGIPTFVHSLNHIDGKGDCKIVTLAELKDNIEFNFNSMIFKVDDEVFANHSIGTKYHFTKKWNWFLVDLGIGAMISERDKRNKWLADSCLIADVNLGAGITKDFDKWNIELMYNFQHLSVPWRSDSGLNFDTISFGINIPF